VRARPSGRAPMRLRPLGVELRPGYAATVMAMLLSVS
jgi:hypothetical protein